MYSSQYIKWSETMKNKMSILIAGLLAAVVVIGVIGATNAYAQSQTSVLPHGGGPGHGRGPRLGQAELEAAAKVLNMTTAELTAALQSGKTLEQIAQDTGVDFQEVQDAIQAAHVAEIRTRIQQAVDEGTITQEHADWLLEGLDKGFIGGQGGFGLGGPHGPGFGPTPDQAPTTQPTPQTSG
jgi:hypothetical protein